MVNPYTFQTMDPCAQEYSYIISTRTTDNQVRYLNVGCFFVQEKSFNYLYSTFFGSTHTHEIQFITHMYYNVSSPLLDHDSKLKLKLYLQICFSIVKGMFRFN